MAMPIRAVIVVFPTPPFRVRTGTNLVSPARSDPILASKARLARTLALSPRFIRPKLSRQRLRLKKVSGIKFGFALSCKSRSAVSKLAGSGSANKSSTSRATSMGIEAASAETWLS